MYDIRNAWIVVFDHPAKFGFVNDGYFLWLAEGLTDIDQTAEDLDEWYL